MSTADHPPQRPPPTEGRSQLITQIRAWSKTVYQEQFSSPGRVFRTEARPTSAHRRNNPQPKRDFLFPRSLKPSSLRPLQSDSGNAVRPLQTRPTEEKGTQLNMGTVTQLPPVFKRSTADANAGRDASVWGQNTVHGHRRQRALSSGALDYGRCSCFHRVKAFHSGHYTVHPEFVSELLSQ
uniref:Uncharacterized protein n=1 Tax=Knipowitschia caucasica TaxID=637954 RepID=A0AAV2M5P5_KNICA